MNTYVVTLQELVRWALVGAVMILLLGVAWRALGQRKRAKKRRKTRRRCAQCGLWEECAPGEPKYGACLVCGGVTSRGRSRKLG